MKRLILLTILTLATACSTIDSEHPSETVDLPDDNLRELAKVFSQLPLDICHVQEVHDAVISSTSLGYDEEYTMDCLVHEPGSGVGSKEFGTKSGKSYGSPLRDLLRDYFEQHPTTKGRVEDMMERLASSDYQFYWPSSDSWDGIRMPIITFDPGYGAESNYGYELKLQNDGSYKADSVYVDERVARKRPVWVLNSNSDAGFTPLELFAEPRWSGRPQIMVRKGASLPDIRPADAPETKSGRRTRTLLLKSFRMLRHYDSWFGGASEFWVKCGSVEGFTASTEAELKLYNPTVTDFYIVVKRKDLGKELPFDIIMVSDFSTQLDRIAFMVTEDDGGSRTNWKCQALVKIESKSYGVELDIPFNEKDDIVWRGQLTARYFEEEDVVSGRFGDTIINFELD